MIFYSSSSKQDDAKSLTAFYKKYASLMYKIAKRILKDEHLAQDAVQEAFISIYNNYEKISQTDCNKIRSLFVIIVRNAAIDLYRKRKKEPCLSLDDVTGEMSEPGESLDEILIKEENFNEFAEKINNIHPAYADILTLKLFHQYNDDEISRILNITPENTRTRLHRARKNLIKLLSQEQEQGQGLEGKNHG